MQIRSGTSTLRLWLINNSLIQHNTKYLFRATTSLRLQPLNAALTSSPTISIKSMSFLSNLFSSSASSSSNNNMSFPVQKTDEEWQAVLSPEQFRIIRQKGTEMAGTGEYNKHYPSQGIYNCVGCSAPLYTAAQKFDSKCGWPAYFDNIPGAVVRKEDRSHGSVRTEIVCANCGGHLGHVFKGERFDTPTDERHCVNSVSLRFTPPTKEGEETK